MTEHSLIAFRDWTYRKHQQERRGMSNLLQLSVAALGISGELDELIDAQHSEEATMLEAGDVLSYVLCVAAMLQCDVEGWLSEEDLRDAKACVTRHGLSLRSASRHMALLRTAARFSESVKKFVTHGTSIPENAHGQLRTVARLTAVQAGSLGITMQAVILANTAKLESRFPGPPEVR